MIAYETFGGGRICVLGNGSFAMNFDGQELVHMNRQQLRLVKTAIEQALNTSTEELGDDLA